MQNIVYFVTIILLMPNILGNISENKTLNVTNSTLLLFYI